jgi:hypothetical protein
MVCQLSDPELDAAFCRAFVNSTTYITTMLNDPKTMQRYEVSSQIIRTSLVPRTHLSSIFETLWGAPSQDAPDPDTIFLEFIDAYLTIALDISSDSPTRSMHIQVRRYNFSFWALWYHNV